MNILYLLRHADSVPRDSQICDFDRALSKRGQKQARRLGEAMLEMKLHPDLIVSSPARRARETCQGLLLSLSYPGEIYYDQTLYLPSPEDLQRAVEDYAAESFLIVSHNTGLEQFLSAWIQRDIALRTCELAILSLSDRKLLDVIRG